MLIYCIVFGQSSVEVLGLTLSRGAVAAYQQLQVVACWLIVLRAAIGLAESSSHTIILSPLTVCRVDFFFFMASLNSLA